MSTNGELILPRVKLSHSINDAAVINVDVPSIKSAKDVTAIARNAFNSGRTRPLSFRVKQLKNVLRFLKENKEAICEALYVDLRKPKHEAIVTEIGIVEKDTKYLLKNLDKWMKPVRPTKGFINFFDGLYVYKEPYGVVVVLSAWNYPLHLALSPFVGAIAAGNCAVLKPSELAPATSQLLFNLLPQYLDSECYPVFEGGVTETTELLNERFDYIFFTGSTTIGKIVHKASNKYLTPVTLELGGKSPTYVDDSADMEIAVRRILWGKLTNCGQTCIAPDYLLCSKAVQEKFVYYAEKVIKEMFQGNAKNSPDYTRIVNERHFNRLNNLLKNQKIAIGGNVDFDDLYIHPTILIDVSPNDDIMQEEIFGPILPIINVQDENEAIEFINKREKPLALYVFTKKKRVRELFLQKTSSGGVTVNDTMMHCTVDTLPFGGVGTSGMGAYHGKNSFDTFTHEKSVLVKDFFGIAEKIQSIRYPPYTKNKTGTLETLLSINREFSFKYVPHLIMFGLGVGVTIGAYYLNKAYNDE